MESKLNDLMLNILENPQFTIEDFLKVGLSALNTSLEDESTYLNSDIITSNPLFQDESGEFDKVKFHNIYLKAAEGLNIMDNKPQDFQAVYSKYNIWAPVDQRETGPTFDLVKISNPDRITKSMISIGLNGPREYTPQEIAQSLKVWNSDTKKWMDTPEDMFSFNKLFTDFVGFFSDNFDTTKVMAQYEEDIDINGKKRGETGFDENLIEHYKGDYMLNDNGTYYYRTLKDGENIYGKLVLHYSDILTREGSALNAIDFLDSDDIQKSPFGTFVKNASLIGAMFIPGGVGAAIAGATIFLLAAGLGATLGKIALGSDNSTMNWLEGLVESTNPLNTRSEWSSIDYGNTGRNTTWTIENLLGMVGDVVGQLRQLRLLFQYAPVLFKGKWGINEKNSKLLEDKYLEELNKLSKKELSKYNPEDLLLYSQAQSKLTARNSLNAAKMVEDYMKSYNKVGEELSKAYMTLLTVNDIYGEAKEAGAEDFDAALVTAGYAAMEYALLSTDIGKWILPELRAERLLNKAMVRALTKDTLKTFKELGKAAKESDEATRTYLLKLVDFGKSIAKGEFNVGLGERAAFKNGEGLMKAGFGSLMAGATAEAVEETSEELLADFSRVLYNGLEALQGKDSMMKPFENAFDRYTMSFLGGFLGGGISSAAFEANQVRKSAKMNYDEAMQHLIYKAHNNDLDGIYKILEKEEIGNKNLSAKYYDKDEKGNIIWKQGDENDNLDLFIKNIVRKQLNMIVNTLNAHGGKTDDKLLDALVLKDLRYRALRNTTTAGLFMLKYNETLTELVKKVNELNSLDTPESRIENGEGDLKGEKNEEVELQRKKLREDIKELDKKIEEFNSGAKSPLFMATALIESTPYIANALMKSTFKVFAEYKTNTPFEQIPKGELERLLTEYRQYLNSDKKDDLQLATKGYLTMSALIKLNLEDALKIILSLTTDPEIGKLLLDVSSSLSKLDFEQDSEKWLESFGKWAAGNSFKVAGLNIEDLINVLYNTYQENVANIDKAYEDDNSLLDLEESGKLSEIDNEIAKINEAYEDSINLGELGNPVDEETRNNSINELNKRKKEIQDAISVRRSEFTKQKDDLLKLAKDNFSSLLNKTMFDISLKQANALADKVLSSGFINGAIKNLVIDKLIGMTRSLSEAKKHAEEIFYDNISNDLDPSIGDLDSFKLELKGSVEAGDYTTPFNDYIINPEEHIKEFETLLLYDVAEQELNTKIEQIKKLGYTPIMDNLDLFAIGIGKNKISNLLDYLGKILSGTRQNVLTFTISDNIHKQIYEAERVLDLYLAALEGARIDNVDPIRVGTDLLGEVSDTSNVWGINKVLNEIHAKAPKLENDAWLDLPEIEGQSADMMIEDVRRIKRLLNSYKTLYSINQGLKLNTQSRVSNKTIYLIYSKLNRLLSNYDFPDKEKLLLTLSELTLLKEQTSKDIHDWNTSLSKEQLKQLAKERILMEDAIFNYFQDKLDDVDKLKEIFNFNNFDLSNGKASLLTESADSIDDVSFIGYLAAKATIKTSSFLKLFKEIYKDGDIAPIRAQEIAVQLGLANILNGNAITNINKALRESILEMDEGSLKEFIKKRTENEQNSDKLIKAYTTESGRKLLENDDFVPQYNNITFIEGVAGSGKSAAVDALIVKYLKRYRGDLLNSTWVTHGGDNRGGKITKEFGTKIGVSEDKCFDKLQLLQTIFDNYIPPKDEVYDSSIYEIDANGKILPKLRTKKDVEAPKVLFIDEIQQFTQIELLALDKWASENGVSIIGSGDLSQSLMVAAINISNIIKEINELAGETLFSEGGDLKVPLTRNLVLHTPKLGTSMRTANNLKNINMSNTQAVQALGYGDIQLHYYEDDTTLAGDMLIGRLNREEITKRLDKLISLLNADEKIDFIYSSSDPSLKEYLEKQEKYNSRINFHKDTALGQEGKYWVVELPGGKDTKKFLLDFYTGQTRGQIFTLMLSPNSINDGKITITNVLDLETHPEEYNPQSIRKFANDEVALLEEIIPNNTEDIPYNPRNTEESNPIQKNVENPKPVKTEWSEKEKLFRELINSNPPPAPKSPLDDFAKDLVENHVELIPYRTAVWLDGKVVASHEDPVEILNIGDRRVVTIDVNGFRMPFYCSTGFGGKKTVLPGKWYPFFGIDPETGWFNKLKESDINKYYDIPLLEAIAKQLDAKYGDVRGLEVPRATMEGEHVDFINKDLNPTTNKTPDTERIVKENVEKVRREFERYNTPTQLNLFPDEEGEVLVEDIDIENENLQEPELKEKLDLENGLSVQNETVRTEENIVINDSIEPGFNLKNFRFKLFGNASFELGGLVVNGKVLKSNIPYRIDGINGIFDPDITNPEWIKLQQEAANNNGQVSVENLGRKLGELRRMLLGFSDKSIMEQHVSDNLGLNGPISIRFAIKTSSMDLDYDTELFGKLEKDGNEKSIFARALINPNSDSNKVNNRFLVAIISSGKHDVIEIPLLNFNNPVTLIRRLDINSSLIRQRFEYYFNNSSSTKYGTKLIEALTKLLNNDLIGKPEYAGLANLIEQYLKTYRNIVFIEDKTWTPSKNLRKLGIQFNIKRGLKNYDDVDYIQTREWIPLNELKADKSFARISKPMQLASRTDSVVVEDSEGNEVAIRIGNPKHPFVLVSDSDYTHDNKLITNDNMLIDEFIYQQTNDEAPKTILLVYVLPPKFTLREYLTSLSKFMAGESKQSPLGNQRTAYKILETLFIASLNNPQELLNCFINALGEEHGTALYNKTKLTVERIYLIDDVKKQIDVLTGTSEVWTEGIPQNIPIYRQLQNVLKLLIRPLKVAIETDDSGNISIYVSHRGSENDFDKLFTPLNSLFEKSGVQLYYQVKGDVVNANGMFIPIQVDENGNILDDNLTGNKEFSITGSVASSAFEAEEEFNNYVESFNKERVEHQPQGRGSFITTKSNWKYVPKYDIHTRETLGPGYSGWEDTPREKERRKTQIKSINPKILNKLKSRLSSEVFNSLINKLTPLIENDESPELLNQIANIINSLPLATKALVIGNNIMLCEDSRFENVNVIFGNPIQNGPNTLIEVTIGDKQYSGVYYNGELKLIENNPENNIPVENVSEIGDITFENVEANLSRFNSLIDYILRNPSTFPSVDPAILEWFDLNTSNGIVDFLNLILPDMDNIEILNLSSYSDILLNNSSQNSKLSCDELKFKFM